MSFIYVAGICGEVLDPAVEELIAGDIGTIACSHYYRSILQNYPGFSKKKWLSITPVGECLKQIKGAVSRGPVLVITSGDPLLFGLGRLLLSHFPAGCLRFIPAVSSLQICFSRFGIPWDDAKIISLHGREAKQLDQYHQEQKLFVFTDKKNSPDTIARYLLESLGPEKASTFTIHVGEKLATTDERLYSGSLEQTAKHEFSQPNCMILINSDGESASQPRFGLTEEELFHSRGLITKNEVRAAVLHALALPEKGVIWDIGAGSGSISIECARLAPGNALYAIEKNETQRENIEKNKNRYRCSNIFVIAGEAPQALAHLPVPDRVFVGGSGGKLEAIVRTVDKLATEKTIIVLTAVTEKTAIEAPKLLDELGYRVTISTIQTTRYVYPGLEQTTFNPITIMVARRKNG
ncbi:MAG: precorrin-6y C5,15-methyltransferase (decarboxylating) subunit CbiE [Desulfofustis sp.]|nr:precorrin-6y C5,15-methyltransferase (decarboxylating) subunit CbiE [Desulfofustis sp.]